MFNFIFLLISLPTEDDPLLSKISISFLINLNGRVTARDRSEYFSFSHMLITHLYFLFGERPVCLLCPFLSHIVWFFLLLICFQLHVYSGYKIFVKCITCKYFLPFYWLFSLCGLFSWPCRSFFIWCKDQQVCPFSLLSFTIELKFQLWWLDSINKPRSCRLERSKWSYPCLQMTQFLQSET